MTVTQEAAPEELMLASEFATARIRVGSSAGRLMLTITDMASGLTSDLDPAELLDLSEGLARVEVDRAANGPRLKIGRPDGQRAIYLDPLQLADAASSGGWGTFPPAYD